ncbi:MFS transporter [Chitinophaga lutea]
MSFAYPLPIRPTRVYRIALSIFFFLQGIVFTSWAGRIPDFKTRFSLSDGELGGLLLSLPAGQMAGMALSGFLVARFGSRPVLLVAGVLYPAALLVVGAMNSIWALAVALAFFGLCSNLVNIASNTQAVNVEMLYRRSIMASFHGVWSTAGLTGVLVSMAMVNLGLSPLAHYAGVFGACVVAVVVAGGYLLPRDVSVRKGPLLVFVKPDRNIVVLGLITFACMICEGTMFDWSSVYFEQEVHAPPSWSRVGFLAFMATMAGGRFMADRFIVHFGVKRMLQGSGVTIMTGLLLAAALPYPAPSMIGFLLVGLGVASVVPMTYSLAGRSRTIQPGVALAMVSSIGFLGFLLGPPLIGFVAEAVGLRWSITLIAVLGLGTTLLAGSLKTEDAA